MEDFPINQAKDGFVWDDGLEELFIKELKLHIKEYIDIARITNKKRTEEEETSKAVSDKVETQVKEVLERSFGNQDELPQLFEQEEFSEFSEYKKYQKEQNNLPETVDDKIRSYKIELNPASKCILSVQWTLGNASTWIKVDSEEDGNTAQIQLNINHPFFKPFSEKEDFKLVLEKFALAFALAEMQAKKNANSEGMISPNAFRTHINRYLEQLTDNE